MGIEDDRVLDGSFKKCLRQIRCAEKFVGTDPEIMVAGLGPLSHPFSEFEANQLAKVGSLASIDDDINQIDQEKLCRTWHLDLPEFNLNNPHWHEALSELVNNRIRLELGIRKDEKIVLKLCKLLLHKGRGRRFVPFTDANAPISVQSTNNNEEEELVFATLSVLLPGGEIVVAFKGTELNFDNATRFDGRNFYEIFFSECNLMTARSMESESYLALAYNLVCSAEISHPLVTESRVIISRVKQFFDHWRMDACKHKCDILSVVLEPKYTTAGLSWHCLNNQDKRVVLAIIAAARKAKFDVYFSKFTCYERIGKYRCSLHDLDLCDEEKAYTFSDFFKVSTEEERDAISIFNGHPGMVRRLRNNTHKTGFNCKNFLLHPANMKDRWSNQVALVLWPSENLDCFHSKGELNLAVHFSLDWTKQLARFQFGQPDEECCNVFTVSISHHGILPMDFISLNAQEKFDSSASIGIIDAFKRTNNKCLFQLFVENVLKSRASVLSANLLKELIDCSIHFGLDVAFPIINTVFEDEKAFYVAVILLRELCTSVTTETSNYSDLIASFAPKILDQLKAPLCCDEKKPKFNITPLMGHDYKVVATATSLLCIYSALGNSNWLLQVIQYIRQNPDRYPVNTVTVHAVHHWNSWLEAELVKDSVAATALGFAVEQKTKLIEECIKQLKQSSESPTEPQDWIRSVNLNCQCQDCKVIEYFMQKPNQSVLNIVIENAEHFEREMHVLEICKGIPDLNVKFKSPEVIVMCKTNASYKMQRKSYEQSMLAIENLQTLLPADHPLHYKQRTETSATQKLNGKVPPIKKTKLNNGQCIPVCMPHVIS